MSWGNKSFFFLDFYLSCVKLLHHQNQRTIWKRVHGSVFGVACLTNFRLIKSNFSLGSSHRKVILYIPDNQSYKSQNNGTLSYNWKENQDNSKANQSLFTFSEILCMLLLLSLSFFMLCFAFVRSFIKAYKGRKICYKHDNDLLVI